MRDDQVGAAVRAVRHRKGWPQSDLARRVRLSRGRLSLIEHGHLDAVRFGDLRRYAAELDISIEVSARWRGGELARLLDADHAALVEWLIQRLERLGWLVRVEVSFNRYGERGRYDVWDGRSRRRSCRSSSWRAEGRLGGGFRSTGQCSPASACGAGRRSPGFAAQRRAQAGCCSSQVCQMSPLPTVGRQGSSASARRGAPRARNDGSALPACCSEARRRCPVSRRTTFGHLTHV